MTDPSDAMSPADRTGPTGSVDGADSVGSVDGAELRAVMGQFATGVAVVTTRVDGHDHAMTANSLTSVSLDPPLILVCVEQDTGWHDAVLESGVWGVSLLADDARATASWLSTGGRPLFGQLARVSHHRGPRGSALLSDALATAECVSVQTHPAGDHTIVVGQVTSARVHDHPGDPLIYHRSRYRTLR